MIRFILKILRNFFTTSYPLWAYGVECNLCKTTFISAKAHYDHVMKYGNLNQHKYKIPKLI